MIHKIATLLKLDTLLGRYLRLDCERSIWVEEEELGAYRFIEHRRKRYRVKIPQTINKRVTLRLSGIGKRLGSEAGDLFLHVWLNKGIDTSQDLWLSKSAAQQGAEKLLRVGVEKVWMVVPPRSRDGMQIRLKGLGYQPDFPGRAPDINLKRGNLLVKLVVYPDRVAPRYGSFDALNTGDMALEGWVYRKIDEVIEKLGDSAFAVSPVAGEMVADIYNEQRWHGIFALLRRHLKLNFVQVQLRTSASIPLPGRCERSFVSQEDGSHESRYVITIKDQFLHNPFAVAAILAHELCHVIYWEPLEDRKLQQGNEFVFGSAEDSLEIDRMVDLLVFMFKIGEFQLRVSRDQRLTFGYFNQSVFERMQVIVSRKLGWD
jgi:hypothetical protein